MADPATQTFVLKASLALPTPILRLLSGGGAVFQGGRTLDPRLQFMANAGRSALLLSSRAATAQGLAATFGRRESGVSVEPLSIDGPAGPIPLRAYRPPQLNPEAPPMAFAHFAGGVIGKLDTCVTFCSIQAKIAHFAVVSVDYRLAPEHRFPTGLEDVPAAYRWARDNTARSGAPAGKVAVGGDSMNGNFAAVVAQQMKRCGKPQPALQLLIYPSVDAASEAPSMATYADSYPLSRAAIDWFMGHCPGAAANPADPCASPIRSGDLSDLAPALLITAGFDPPVYQGEAYAKRLRDAGVPAVYRCYDTLSHGFTAFTGAVPPADVACREIAGLVREGCQGRIH
jgi:acetyl esterase